MLECSKWSDLGGTRIDGSVRAAWVCVFADGSAPRILPRGANRGRSRNAQQGYPCQLWRLHEIGSDAVVPSNASDLQREPFGPPVSAEQSSSHATIVPRLFHVEHFTSRCARHASLAKGQRPLSCPRQPARGALPLHCSTWNDPGAAMRVESVRTRLRAGSAKECSRCNALHHPAGPIGERRLCVSRIVHPQPFSGALARVFQVERSSRHSDRPERPRLSLGLCSRGWKSRRGIFHVERIEGGVEMPSRGTLVSFGGFKRLAPMRWFPSLSASHL